MLDVHPKWDIHVTFIPFWNEVNFIRHIDMTNKKIFISE